MLPRDRRYRPFRFVVASGLVAVGAVAPGSGQLEEPPLAESAAPADAVRLTTEAAVALALSNSRQLKSLDTKVEIQQYRRSGGWIDNPELRVRNLSTRSVDEHFDELEVGIRWRPPALGEAAERRQEGQVQLWEQKVAAQRARNWVASRVRRACADVIMYRELVRIASDRVDNEARRIIQIKSMVDLGRRSIVYYTKAKMMVSEARNERTRRFQSLSEEQRRLRRLTGTASAIDVVFEPLPAVKGVQETLLSIAYTHRPEVQLVEARQQLAIKRHQRQRQRRWPQLSFVEVSHHRERGADDRHEIMFGPSIPRA